MIDKESSFGQGKISPEELAGYEPGGVVSKTLMESFSGTVTAFAVDKGQGLSEHRAPYDVLLSVVEGQIDFVLEDNKHSLLPGDILLMKANARHSLHAIRPSRFILAMLKG